MEFEWDENKAKRNQEKHAVSFDEAKTVFDDPVYLIFPIIGCILYRTWSNYPVD